MLSKPQLIQEALEEGNDREALRIAAGFPHLGEHKVAIQRGWAAMRDPAFYRQIGQDPDALIAVGIAAVRARYLS